MVRIAVSGPRTMPYRIQVPSGMPISPAIETAARPGTTNTYPEKIPVPSAPAMSGSPRRPICGPAERTTGEASTTWTST